jgi:hypothetical protein
VALHHLHGGGEAQQVDLAQARVHRPIPSSVRDARVARSICARVCTRPLARARSEQLRVFAAPRALVRPPSTVELDNFEPHHGP